MSKAVEIPECVRAAGDVAVETFRTSIRKGNTPRFAEMVALRRPSALNGDDTTFHNALDKGNLERRYKPEKLARMKAKARAAGINVDKGWEYYPGLANHEDDPRGWVGPTTTRADIAKRIAAEGNGCKELGVKVRPAEDDPNKRVHRLAPDLVQEQMQNKLQADPGLAAACKKSRKKLRELKNNVIETHGAASDRF